MKNFVSIFFDFVSSFHLLVEENMTFMYHFLTCTTSLQLSMGSQPQNPDFRNNPENLHQCACGYIYFTLNMPISKIRTLVKSA